VYAFSYAAAAELEQRPGRASTARCSTRLNARGDGVDSQGDDPYIEWRSKPDPVRRTGRCSEEFSGAFFCRAPAFSSTSFRSRSSPTR